MPERVKGEPRLTSAPKATSRIVDACNDYGAKKACGWRVNLGVNEQGPVPARSRPLMRQMWRWRSISHSIPCVADTIEARAHR